MAYSAKVNKTREGTCPPLHDIGPFEGLAAAPGFSATSVITTPNQRSVPKFAIARSEITTFADGRWGYHEYSRWPQLFDHAHVHVACIPRQGSARAPSAPIVWRTWEALDWNTKECGVPRFGQLRGSLLHELDTAAESAIASASRIEREDHNIKRIRHFLTICVRHCVDRLRLLPSERSVIISLAAHAQRLILELAGLEVYASVVLPRIESQDDWRASVLDILGALSADPSVVHFLHRAGVPVWFQQQLTKDVAIWSVVQNNTLPISFSTVPSYPRLVLARRDLSGALTTPGEWQRAMDATVRRQLCSSRLPSLQSDPASSSEPPAKRPCLILGPERSRTLGHDLRPPSQKAPAALASAAHGKRSSPRLTHRAFGTRKPYTMNPFRQHYASYSVEHSPVWARALRAVSPLPQPQASVTYFFPPPWLIDRLVGYDFNGEKVTRYIHHFVAIRTFCHMRLFDHSIAGRPLTISEWRDALWGDYALDEPDSAAPIQAIIGAGDQRRSQARHRLKQNLRALFGKLGSLPSYDSGATPVYGDTEVTQSMAAHEERLRCHLVWEAHETNWRCELLALDAVMVESSSWPELERWTREAHISEVWGPSRSGLALCPDPEAATPFCWTRPPDPGWEETRAYLQAFVDLLVRWPGCPEELRHVGTTISSMDGPRMLRIEAMAVEFYVRTFVARFHRLPTPPVRERPVCELPAVEVEASTLRAV